MNHPHHRPPQMPDDDRMYELLAACGPDSDLLEPEMAELARRLEQDGQLRQARKSWRQWDEEVRGALQDVEVPAGLAGRLHAAVDAGPRQLAAESVTDESETPPTARPTPAQTEPRSSRRGWLWTAASIAAAAALVLIVVSLWPTEQHPLSAEQWADVVHREWLDALEDEQWSEQDLSQKTERYPVGSAVAFRPQQWQMVDVSGHRGIAYRMNIPPDQSEALLFVVPMAGPQRALPMFPSSTPDSASRTGDWSIGVWQNRGRMYALAVEGQGYKNLIRIRPGYAVHRR